MARKAKAVRRRARKSFNVIHAALGLAQANISLLEIVQDPQLLSTIGMRAVDPSNILNMAVKSAALDIGSRFALRALSRPRRNINKSLRMLNLGVSL